MTEFNRLHAICVYLRNKPCELCPEREPSQYGESQRLCYGLAQEVSNIAIHGHPRGALAKPEHVVRWQRRFNDE